MQVYADNAATTRMSDKAVAAMTPYFQQFYGNPSSLHTVGQQAAEALADARRRVADCLGCSFKEITFTSGGSEADNQAIVSAARIGERKGKKHIISTAFEHHAVLHTLKKLEKEGFEVTLLDVGPTGTITPQQVAEAIREDTCLVTIMYANNEIGSILPIPEIGKVCHEKGVLFHTDAVQAAGHLHINVKEQNIDMLSLSGLKFHGPKGVGVLYARQGIPLTNIIEGGAQERGKRAGTENIPGIMGLAAALEESCGHIDEDTARLTKLRDKLIAGLSKIPHSALNGDPVHRLPPNVNICIAGIDGNGQSELVYALTGLMKPESGKIFLNNKDITHMSIRKRSLLGMSHIPEDRHKHGLVLDYPLEYNMILQRYFEPRFTDKAGFLRRKNIRAYAERLIEQYDVRSGQGPATIARSMSGGNQQKAIIAREIDRDPKRLVAVQPTRGLDVGAIEYIHRQIVAERDKGKAVLLVSLELDEVMNLSDRILVMYEGEIVGEFDPKTTTVQELGLYMAGARKQGKEEQ